jgi:hydroxyacylglutathione hydrolase
MRVVSVPCLKDNYAYLVISELGNAAVVDPGEAAPVLDAIAREGVTLTQVWATHHHADHVGGIDGLAGAVADLQVIAHGHDRGRVPRASRLVDDGAEVVLDEIRATVIHNPGHTLGAISYWTGGDDGAVFTGDTLFGAGCGRLFEGSPTQMHRSMTRLTALPPATRVYFGHEYTESNLRFAAAVEPGNPAVTARATAAAAARADGQPTTPSTVADERASNPFARCSEPAVRAAARTAEPDIDVDDPIAVLAAIRRWKDRFR